MRVRSFDNSPGHCPDLLEMQAITSRDRLGFLINELVSIETEIREIAEGHGVELVESTEALIMEVAGIKEKLI